MPSVGLRVSPMSRSTSSRSSSCSAEGRQEAVPIFVKSPAFLPYGEERIYSLLHQPAFQLGGILLSVAAVVGTNLLSTPGFRFNAACLVLALFAFTLPTSSEGTFIPAASSFVESFFLVFK